MTRGWTAAAMAAVLGSGCSSKTSGDPPATIDPAHGKASGYYTVTVSGVPGGPFTSCPAAPSPDEECTPTHVRLGGVNAYGLAVAGDRLTFTVQGAPNAGPADLMVADVPVEVTAPFSYDSVDAHFARFVAIGASVGQGVQNGVPSGHGALMSPPAQLARQLGGFFPLPVFVPTLLQEISVHDIGAPPGCDVPDVAAFVAKHPEVFLKVLKEGYGTARVDAELVPHNLAVGGSHLHSVVYGPDAGDQIGNLLGHLVYQPHDTDHVKPQLDVAESLAPTLIIIADLYGNDVIDAIFAAAPDAIEPARITPEASFRADLKVLCDRLEKTGAEVFIANLPPVSLLPAMKQHHDKMAAKQGMAAADAARTAVDERATAFNAILAEEAAKHKRIHVVDTVPGVNELATKGLDIGGQHLTVKKFGGLLSLDGLHFSNTGYATLANLFVEAINAKLGTHVPLIDLAAIVAADPLSPKAIAAAGFDASKCAP
jgi:lysophospholipase L1-like esterase